MKRSVQQHLLTTLACLMIASPDQARGRDCLECWREVCDIDRSFNLDNNFQEDCCNCVSAGSCIPTLSDARNSTDCCDIAQNNLLPSPSDNDACSSSEEPYPFTSPESLVLQNPQKIFEPGTYIVPSFKFNCSGCIDKVLLLAMHPENITVQLDLLTWSRITDEDDEDVLYVLNSNVSLTVNETNIMSIPADVDQFIITISLPTENPLCFNEGDEFGFSSSSISVLLENDNSGLVYVPSPSNDDTCQNLNDIHTTALQNLPDGSSLLPLMAIRIGRRPSFSAAPQLSSSTLPSATTTATICSSIESGVSTPPLLSSPEPTTMQPTFDTTETSSQEAVSLNVIIGVSAGLVVVVLLALVCISSLLLFIMRGRRLDKVDGSGRGITRVRSQRLERRLQENSSAELLPTRYGRGGLPVYDYPHTQVHTYHELEGLTSTDPDTLVSSGNYTTMQPAGSIRDGAITPIPNGAHSIYDDDLPPASELQDGAPQLPPPRLQGKPVYHVLEGPGVINGKMVAQVGYDDPVELVRRKGSREEVVNPIYNEIEPGPQQHLQMVDPSIRHSYHMLEDNNSQQAGEVGEPETVEGCGLYVPTAEERRRICNSGTTTELENWIKKNRLESTKTRRFFESVSTYWQPPSDVDSLYNTLAQRKYREILADQIQIVKFIGSGQFGTVNLAVWTQQFLEPMDVAVKVCRAGKNEAIKAKFLKEAAIMGQFKHPNVVKLYGVVTMSELPMIMLELMKNGDMLDYMKKNFEPGRLPPPSPNRLLSFSLQVASGMEYLSGKAFVHRDLAARNILLNELHQCKIGDFGMARDLEDSEYYIMSRKGPMPFKWTAPEALNYRKYSTFSDCYSYGMVLYEIWSVGREPLPGVSIKQVPDLVSKGFCQAPPPGCPRAIYELMVKLWNPKKRSRPTFPEIVQCLKQPEEQLLAWSEEDSSVSGQAAVLGAPLEEGNKLYPGLQNAYQSSWC